MVPWDGVILSSWEAMHQRVSRKSGDIIFTNPGYWMTFILSERGPIHRIYNYIVCNVTGEYHLKS